MTMDRGKWLAWLCCLACCGVFAAAGWSLLRYPGVQYDEVLFITAIHAPEEVEYTVDTPWGRVPLMLMTYVGTLKAALYTPVVRWVGSGVLTLRVPVLLLGALSIGIFFFTARRLAGTWAAALAALVLATDAVYLLTCVFDWGPVAIQHALFAAVLYCAVRCAERPRARWLFLGGLAAGLALWDKALFGWVLAGAGLALLAVFGREVWRLARNRRFAAAAVGGFVLGAAPFLYYNAQRDFRTFAGQTLGGGPGWKEKVAAMDITLNGSGLFGYLVRESPEGPPANLKPWEKAPLWLVEKTGGHRASLQHVLLVAALALAPLIAPAGLRRLGLFLAAAFGAGWGLMILTAGAGASLHHTVLLWPLPQMSLALALAGVGWRFPRRGRVAAAALALIAAASNGLVLNQYLAHFIAAGPALIWTDAIRPLVNEIGRIGGRRVFAADWGIQQQVEYFGAGRIALHRPGDGVLVSIHEPLSVVYLENTLADPQTLFVTRTEGREAFAGVRARLLEFAAARGYKDHVLRVIHDRHGAPMFEIREFRK
jgi:hypothetical protein